MSECKSTVKNEFKEHFQKYKAFVVYLLYIEKTYIFVNLKTKNYGKQ